jgi:exopolysaccharide production protein ExoY
MSLSTNLNLLRLEHSEVDFESVNSCSRSPKLFSRVNCWNYRYVKRGLDLTGALTMSAVFLIPAIAIAIAVTMDSPGKIFYREMRVGRNGKQFELWKFRSMNHAQAKSTESHFSPSHEDDFSWRTVKNLSNPRVTRVGSFIRRWSLDELPQLFNVLRGEMSLIGPRPVIAAELPLYQNLVQYYLSCTPGLSGLWQVSGRSNLTFKARATLDAGYVCAWSLRTDLKILALTVPAVIFRVGAR